MEKPPLPDDESARLSSLHSLRILDTPDEDRFDRITRMAQRVFDVRICLVSLVDSDRQWFKSKQGTDVCETSREISFCGHAILDEEILIVSDAAGDPRFSDNPLVTDDPKIRFYAGCPIGDPKGFRIGTLCLIDPQPRVMTESDIATLADLTAMVEDEVKVTSQVTIDELTEVANRRGFYQIANHLLSLCRRTGTAAELAYFDLDGFKSINDAQGHAAGDEVLRHFAQLLVRCFRSADAIGRLGGDEFVVLLSGSAGMSGTPLKRLRDMAAEAAHEIKHKVAWSVGAIQFDPDRHDTLESLLAEADSRMYSEKVRRRLASP